MKKILYILICFAAVLSACTKVENKNVAKALEVVLSSESVDIMNGGTHTLTARVLPGTISQNVTWSVMNPEIATVEDGVITAVSPGVTYVVATSEDLAAVSSCKVNVHEKAPYEFFITDAEGNVFKELYAYPGYTTTVNLLTTDYLTHTYTWSSSNPAVVTVDRNGKLTFKSPASSDNNYLYYGETFITARVDDGYGCQFRVTSSVAKQYLYDGRPTAFGSDVYVSGNSQHKIAVQYFDGNQLHNLPVKAYTLTSSDSSNFTLTEESTLWTMTVSNDAEADASIKFKIGDAPEVMLTKVIVE